MKEYICAMSGIADTVAMIVDRRRDHLDRQGTHRNDRLVRLHCGTYNDDNYKAMMHRVDNHGSKLGAFGALRFFCPDTVYNLPTGKYRA